MLQVFLATILLQWGTISTDQASLSQNIYSEAILETAKLDISQASLQKILNVVVPQVFGLTIEESWAAYNNGELVITELEVDNSYKLTYDGGAHVIILSDF